jgi:hypothetical protein
MNIDALLILVFLVGLPFFLYSRSPRYKRLHGKNELKFKKLPKRAIPEKAVSLDANGIVKIILTLGAVVAVLVFVLPALTNTLSHQSPPQPEVTQDYKEPAPVETVIVQPSGHYETECSNVQVPRTDMSAYDALVAGVSPWETQRECKDIWVED